MKIAIHGRKVNESSFPFIAKLLTELSDKGAEIFLSASLHELLRETSFDLQNCRVYADEEGVPEVNFTVSIGGDGTLLETVTHVGAKETPILGVNTGRLGFLATVSQDHIKGAIDALDQQRYSYEYRTLVELEGNMYLQGLNFALNEVAIIKKDTSSMIVVHTYVDDQYLNSYWSDGLIIATPTGSTGYSLSCGGPVVSPQSSNLIITPVSPHNLTVRPLVISDESVVTVQVESRSDNFLLSLDSRSYTVAMNSNKMTIRKNSFKVKLIKFGGYSFLETLRQKLHWGLDVRN